MFKSNNLVTFHDPVGLTPEENEKAWDKIIQADIDQMNENLRRIAEIRRGKS